jgi:hypothetical protein
VQPGATEITIAQNEPNSDLHGRSMSEKCAMRAEMQNEPIFGFSRRNPMLSQDLRATNNAALDPADRQRVRGAR